VDNKIVDRRLAGAVIISGVLDRPVPIRPLLISKMNTLMQITLAGTILATRASASPSSPRSSGWWRSLRH